MELLCLKFGEKYIRVPEEGYEITGMNKASVFPVSDSEKVMRLLAKYKKELHGLKIVKLRVIEEEYQA